MGLAVPYLQKLQKEGASGQEIVKSFIKTKYSKPGNVYLGIPGEEKIASSTNSLFLGYMTHFLLFLCSFINEF